MMILEIKTLAIRGVSFKWLLGTNYNIDDRIVWDMFANLRQAFENNLRKWIILIVHDGSYGTCTKLLIQDLVVITN